MSRPSTRRPRRGGRRDVDLSPSRARRARRLLLAVAAALVVLLAAALIYRGIMSGAAGPAAPTAAPTVDPRLIIRPHAAKVTAVLPRDVRLTGTLYPDYPGRNTLQLDVWHAARALDVGRPLRLIATMPGMAMRPVKATLVRRGHHFVGTLNLTMFGTYSARVVVDTPVGQVAATLMLVLSLPRL